MNKDPETKNKYKNTSKPGSNIKTQEIRVKRFKPQKPRMVCTKYRGEAFCTSRLNKYIPKQKSITKNIKTTLVLDSINLMFLNACA